MTTFNEDRWRDMREYLKSECINIYNQKINITKMYEKKTGLPWSYLLNNIIGTPNLVANLTSNIT